MQEDKCEVTKITQNTVNNKNEKPTAKSKASKIFNLDKLKGIKGSKIVVPMVMLAVVMLIYGSLTTSSVITSSSNKNEESNTVNFTSGMDYIQQVEEKLASVLSTIKNAGDTKVMISINGSPELEIAENVEEKTVTTTNGTTVTVVTEPIMVEVNGEKAPVVLKETLPEIKGVIVVSSGANDPKVKLDIITAVKVLLGIPSGNIEVFAGI